MKHKIIKALGAGLLALAAAGSASAFPDKPVRIVVPYPAGGSTDVAARIVAERLTAIWGQPVLVHNKPGATGAIGTELVTRSPADGHTMLLQIAVMLSTEVTRPSVAYRTLRDPVPMTTVFVTSPVLVASSSAPQGGLKEVLAAGREQPRLLNYGHHGDGTTTHYMGEKLKKLAGVDMVAVPYAGDGPMLNDLLGGHLSTAFLSAGSAIKAVDAGQARILAVASANRSPLLPAAPTFAEAGLEGFERESWGKLFVPAGTPAPVVEQVAREVAKIVRSPDVQQRFAAHGLVGVGGTPAQTLQEVQAEHAAWVQLVKEFGAPAKP
jgi:tripartite-type tricarboxylate transporter receptor subunit TctC